MVPMVSALERFHCILLTAYGLEKKRTIAIRRPSHQTLTPILSALSLYRVSLLETLFFLRTRDVSLTSPTDKYFCQNFQFFPLLKPKNANFFPVFSCGHRRKSSWHLSNGAKRRKFFRF